MSSKFNAPKIEPNIPLPPRGESIFGKWKSVLLNMNPGDSFRVQNERERNALYRSAQCQKMEITTRKLNGSGYRIWRIK